MAESAASYVSILNFNEKPGEDNQSEPSSLELPTAFSLAKFIPLLEERIHVINPFTRTFLVSWLTLLDTIPDLELVHYLPAFLGGLFKFLGDPNRDVYVATQGLLERFLTEIKKIAKIKKGIAESRKSRIQRSRRASSSRPGSGAAADSASDDNAIEDSESGTGNQEHDHDGDDWIPGQDVQVDHAKILDILLKFVDVSSTEDSDPILRLEGLSKQKEEEIGIVALRWIDSFFEVSPEDILPFVPRLLTQVLPALSAQSDQVRTTASKVNRSLMDYIVTLQEEAQTDPKPMPPPPAPHAATRAGGSEERRQSATASRPAASQSQEKTDGPGPEERTLSPENASTRSTTPPPQQTTVELDYAAAVNALTLQFLNEHEATRVAALSWLLMLHRKAPKKVLAFNDGTFPALLKTLSDPADTVVTRDLQLLSQISKNSEDGYFTSFMVNLLQLFSTDRKLLENRGNLIIRQLCLNLMPERIYRTLADCIEKDEDVEFASIMVQNLNNNLITAPELAELRKRLRNLESKDGQMFFVALFRAWCYNAVATFSLCLLAQAYEQAYNLLQIFADLEMTVNMLIQIDKLVQLLESPVFTCKHAHSFPSQALMMSDLRLQLLEPDRYPYLYKCLYGLLMLLPQSSAFAALKNRLNSVSAIGLLHTPAAMPTSARSSYVPSSSAATHNRQRSTEKGVPLPIVGSLTSSASANSVVSGMSGSTLPSNPTSSAVARLNRGARGPEGGLNEIKWPELLEKFKSVQEKARQRNSRMLRGEDDDLGGGQATKDLVGAAGEKIANPQSVVQGRPGSALSLRTGGSGTRPPPTAHTASLVKAGSGLTMTGGPNGTGGAPAERPGHKSRPSLAGNLGKFASGIARAGGGSRDRDRAKK